MFRFIFSLTACLLAFSVTAPNAMALDTSSYGFENGFVRETPSTTTAAYIVIHNTTDKDDTLIGASADWAERIELHEVKPDAHGVMKMQQIPNMPLAAQSELELKPGGYHMMIFGVKNKLAQGTEQTITLEFEKAGKIAQKFIVQPISYQGETKSTSHDHTHDAHDHHGHHHD